MNHWWVIGIGGAIGSILRFYGAQTVQVWLGKGFPYGTLFVNVVGSLLIGILFIVLTQRPESSAEWRAFLMVGVLGGFTTFSSFSLETVLLMSNGDWLKASANVIVSVIACLVATAAGIGLAKQIMG